MAFILSSRFSILFLDVWETVVTKLSIIMFCVFALVVTPALATETVTYTYDAQGRLIKTVLTGTVNNGLTTVYTIDKADNRTIVIVTGALH